MRRSADERAVCPSCGRESLILASGQCAFCLQPLTGDGSRVEIGQIIRFGDLERAREKARRSQARRSTRWVRAVLVGLSVGTTLWALLLVGMKWLSGFFDKSTAWRG
jgi:hypothetical protein